MKITRLLFMLIILGLNACDLFNQDNPLDTNPISKRNLLVIDEANQVMNSLDLDSLSVSYHSYVGPAANQILIEGDYAYLVVSLSHTILRLNLASGGAPDTYGYFGSPNPYMMALDDSRIYVTLLNDNILSVFDKSTLSIQTNIALSPGNYPQGIAINSNSICIATSVGYLGWGDTGNYTNAQILILDKTDYSTITNISVHTNPQSLLIKGDDLFLTCPSQYNNSGAVQRLNLGTFALETLTNIDALAPGYMGIGDNKLYVTDDEWTGNGGVFIWDILTGETNHILPGIGIRGVAFDSDYIYCSSTYNKHVLYRIEKTNHAHVTAISNVGGGDIEIYL